MTHAAIVGGELAGLDVELGDLAGVDGHGRTLCRAQNQSSRLTQKSVSRTTVGHDEAADAEDEERRGCVSMWSTSQPKFWPKKPVTSVQATNSVPPIVSRVATALSRSEFALK